MPLSPEDITRLRAETPALHHLWPPGNLMSKARSTAVAVTGHGRRRRPLIHFNNAGASLMPQPVEDVLHQYISYESTIGSYEAQEGDWKQRIEEVYNLAGAIVNAKNPQVEIALLESATVAWCNAFHSFPVRQGDVILSCKSEYGANFVSMLQVAKRKGATIRVIPNDEHGQTDVRALEKMLEEDTIHDGNKTEKKKKKTKTIRLVSITHIPTNSGLVNPCEEIGNIINNYSNVLYLMDACQTVGQMPVDVQKLKCHMLSTASRKYLRGPRGCGFLYVQEDVLLNVLDEPPMIDHYGAPWKSQNEYKVRPEARRYEKWECNTSARVGMGEAIRYALYRVGVENIWERIQHISTYLRNKLATLRDDHGGIVTPADIGKVKCGIVTFRVKNVPDFFVKQWLRDRGINVTVSTGAVTRLDMDERGLATVVRASVHYYNTEEEVDLLIEALLEMVASNKVAASKL